MEECEEESIKACQRGEEKVSTSRPDRPTMQLGISLERDKVSSGMGWSSRTRSPGN